MRNRSDGTVEAVFQEKDAVVDAMVAACEIGPGDAVVTSVAVEPWSNVLDSFFSQRPTV